MIDDRLDQIIEGIEDIKETAESKQDALESGTNIKTVNNQSILGEGNLDVGSDITVDSELSSTSENPVQNKAIYNQFANVNDNIREGLALKQNTLESGTNIKTINNESVLGQGNIAVQEPLVGSGGQVAGQNIKTINNQSILGSGNIEIQTGGTVDTAMSDSSENAVQNKVIKTYVDGEIQTVDGEIDTIESKIPAQATSNNKLADKDFVNSSISTATATFRGTFTSLSTLQSTEGDMNDYAFYSHTDSDGNTVYDRYKYVGLLETRVPDGYTEKLFITKPRNVLGYINTKYKIQSTDRIVIKYYGAGYIPSVFSIFGASDSDNNSIDLSKQYLGSNVNISSSTSSSLNIGRPYNQQWIFELKDGKAYTKDIDGQNNTLVGNFSFPSVNENLYIFAKNNYNSDPTTYSEPADIGDFIIYDSNNIKKLELVPCIDTIGGNVVGYYDTVHSEFIQPTNGTFIIDPNGRADISTDRWLYEYSLNNSSFTAAQWATIGSGLVQNITSTGYDATATQVLKNVNGTIQWVTET